MIVARISDLAMNLWTTAAPAPLSSVLHHFICCCHLLPIDFLLPLLLFLALSIEYLILNIGASLILLAQGLITDLLCQLRVHACCWSLDIEVHK